MQHSRRFRVTYTKHFVSGLLKGMTFKPEHVHFPTASSAVAFHAKLTKTPGQVFDPCAGSSMFTVSDVSITDTQSDEMLTILANTSI